MVYGYKYQSSSTCLYKYQSSSTCRLAWAENFIWICMLYILCVVTWQRSSLLNLYKLVTSLGKNLIAELYSAPCLGKKFIAELNYYLVSTYHLPWAKSSLLNCPGYVDLAPFKKFIAELFVCKLVTSLGQKLHKLSCMYLSTCYRWIYLPCKKHPAWVVMFSSPFWQSSLEQHWQRRGSTLEFCDFQNVFGEMCFKISLELSHNIIFPGWKFKCSY